MLQPTLKQILLSYHFSVMRHGQDNFKNNLMPKKHLVLAPKPDIFHCTEGFEESVAKSTVSVHNMKIWRLWLTGLLNTVLVKYSYTKLNDNISIVWRSYQA